jgi:hypothetical protein
MRYGSVFVLLLATTALRDRAWGGGGEETPKRERMTCVKLRQQLERTAREMGIEDRIVPRSWGTIPSELQKLPPASELCGVDDLLGQAVIASPLYGDDLQAHYAPLFARFGCRPLSCNIISGQAGLADQTRCRCAGPGIAGTVNTDIKNQAYAVSITVAKR